MSTFTGRFVHNIIVSRFDTEGDSGATIGEEIEKQNLDTEDGEGEIR